MHQVLILRGCSVRAQAQLAADRSTQPLAERLLIDLLITGHGGSGEGAGPGSAFYGRTGLGLLDMLRQQATARVNALSVYAHRQIPRRTAHDRLFQMPQAFAGGQRAHAALCQSGMQLSVGGASGFTPGTPRNTDRVQTGVDSRFGQSIQIGTGQRMSPLTRCAETGGGRGIQEQVATLISERRLQLVSCRAFDLQQRLHARGVEIAQRSVVQQPGAVNRTTQAAIGAQCVEAGRQHRLIADIAGHPAYFTTILPLQGIDPLIALGRAAWCHQGDARRALIGQPMAAQTTQTAECAGYDMPAAVLEALCRQAGAVVRLHAERLYLRYALAHGNPAFTALCSAQAR